MEISANQYRLNPDNLVSSNNNKKSPDKSVSENSNHNQELKQKLKEAATEMLKEPRVLGEWEDKKGLDETTDPAIGGDIRYALTTKNIDFLKRLLKGGLTIPEVREVTHKIRELEQAMIENPDMLSGKMIDTSV